MVRLTLVYWLVPFLTCSWGLPAAANYRETKVANQFQMYVPPNNDTGTRYSVIVVTALSGTPEEPCVVDLIDDGADGDTDDTVQGVSLSLGRSLVRYIREGAVNDDAGGKWDGDYFRVAASKPVSVYFATDSDWQHDWAPAANGTQRGTRFFLYTNGYSVSRRDVDVFAYESDTRVELYDVTANALTTSGVTSLTARPALPVLSADLDEGEDLIVKRGLGRDLLDRGRTYELIATKPVTVLFGAIASVDPQNQARDGGGFVPGRSGSAVDDDFYFHVPANPGALNEQEIRIISANDGVAATLYGWNQARGSFEQVRAYALGRLDHADYVGGPYQLYRLRTTRGKVVAFEANWMETGSPGTSDESSFVPGLFGADGSHEFLAYLGPPGRQVNSVVGNTMVHLYLYSREGQNGVSVRDADTLGNLVNRTINIPAGGYADVAFDVTQYNTLNRPTLGIRPYIRVLSPTPIAVDMANWNDNWMSYATATVLRNPDVVLEAPSSASLGETLPLRGTVSNTGLTPLTDVKVEVLLPPGVQYQSGMLGGNPETSVSGGSSGTSVTYELVAIAPLSQVAFLVNATMTQAAGSSGEVLGMQAVVSANEAGTRLGSTDSAPTQVLSPAVATLSDLTVLSGDRTVNIAVRATGGPNPTTLTVERSAQPSTGFVTLAASTRSFPGGLTQLFSFTDVAVTNGANYYYRIRGIGPTGEVAYAGPVLGQPRDTTPPSAPLLSTLPADRSVTLLLSRPSAPDLTGYRLYRRRAGTATFSAVGPTLLNTETFLDAGLVNGTTYEYRAVAVDDDGNVSPYSTIVSATPMSPPGRTTDVVVQYEDMIGAGQNDWDYNDFVVRIQVGETLSAGGLSRLTINYEPLARGAGYVQRFRHHLTIRGAYSGTLVRYAADGTVTSSRDIRGSGELDLVIYEKTTDALPAVVKSYANTERSQASPLAGNAVQLVLDVDPRQNVDGSYGSAPFDPYLVMPYLPEPNAVHLPSFGGPSEVTTRLSSISGHALDFAFVTDSSDATWAFEAEPVWLGYPEHPLFVTAGNPTQWFKHPKTPESVWRRNR